MNGDFEDALPGSSGPPPWIVVSRAPGGFVGWTGSDIEWGQESLYVTGDSTTIRVIEMDGNGGSAITRIQQSFTVDGNVNGTLSFDMALRANLSPTAGEGLTVDLLNGGGTVIQTQTYLPTVNTWQTVTLSVPFDTAGTYSIRFTGIGPNNSLGAVIDNVSFVVCFTAGTLIDTPGGPRPVEDLRPGDLISKLDNGPQPVPWVGHRSVTRDKMMRDLRLRPVTIAEGAFGPSRPVRDLAFSRQHRILRTRWASALFFAEPEVLVPAYKLANGRTFQLTLPRGDVTYVHFLCDRHEIVIAEGLATESLYPTRQSLGGVEAKARAELLLIFPELRTLGARPLSLARPVVEERAARLLA